MNISTAQGIALTSHMTDTELRASVSRALFEQQFVLTGQRGEDQPEDLYIALLASARSQPVLEGCIDVFRVIGASLFGTPANLPEGESRALYHLMRLVGTARPIDLRAHVHALVQLVLKPDVPKRIRNPVMRTAVAYASSEADARFWEPLVAENVVPGLAFKALLQIDAYSARIRRDLVSLIRRELRSEIAVSAITLLADASRARGCDEQLIKDVIAEVSSTSAEVRAALVAALRAHTWSVPWITFAIPPQRKPHTPSITLVREATRKPISTVQGYEYADMFTALASAELVIRGRFPDVFPGKIAQGIQIFTPETQIGRQEDVREMIAGLYEILTKPAERKPKIFPMVRKV